MNAIDRATWLRISVAADAYPAAARCELAEFLAGFGHPYAEGLADALISQPARPTARKKEAN